jgi:fatty-acyl-CoA synthase
VVLSNYQPLSPVSYLDRASAVFGSRLAVLDGDEAFTYRQLASRSLALTGVLANHGVDPGDRVATLCSNSHIMIELHHAVPLRGAVLVTLNTRLSEPELASILRHCGAKVLASTREHAATAERLARSLGIVHLGTEGTEGTDEGYERQLADANPAPDPVEDERALLAINYTSGTTGRPKGVMYHHRGAWLQAQAMAYHTNLRPGSRYLWTLPMFHCNGWCFPWAVTAAGATHVCLRRVDTTEVWKHLRAGITHLSGAPTVLTMIAEDPAAADGALAEAVQVTTGGAPPSPALLRRMERLNFTVVHLYGLTETFGPIAINQWQPEWQALDDEQRAFQQARQGIPNISSGPMRVVDESGQAVEPDARSVGELQIRGNNVMLGYYADEAATADASVDGWFRTGDLAVVHPDGYVEITDRLKDIIVSGGENIASVEVERVLDSHPEVIESAVVGRPDERWGEVPVAFVDLRPGASTSAAALAGFARRHLAGYKVPRHIVFGALPKTSTGKIQKAELRRHPELRGAPERSGVPGAGARSDSDGGSGEAEPLPQAPSHL